MRLAVKLARHTHVGRRLRLSINWGARCRSDCGRDTPRPPRHDTDDRGDVRVWLCASMYEKKLFMRTTGGRRERFEQNGSRVIGHGACFRGLRDRYVYLTISITFLFHFSPYIFRLSIIRYYVIVCTQIAI